MINKILLVLFLTVPALVSAEKRSLGGTPVKDLTKTAFGLVLIEQSDGEFECSGVLIDQTHFATAGHCGLASSGEEDFAPSQYRVKVGGKSFSVIQLDVNPGYNPDAEIDDASSKFDIAILTLNSAVTKVKPIALGKAPRLGETLTFFGYGSNNRANQSASKRAAKGLIKVNRIGDGVFSSVRRQPNKFATTCAGDSGGAVVRKVGSNFQLVGLVSAGTTGDNRDGTCRASSEPDEDTYVDLASSVSRNFIAEILN